MGVKYLSDEWFAKTDELSEEVNPEIPEKLKNMKINLTATSDSGDVDFAMNGGKIQKGYVDDASAKITIPYDIAFKVFVLQNQTAGMQAFTSGKLKIKGDMTKSMMALRNSQPTESQKQLQEKMKEITEA